MKAEGVCRGMQDILSAGQKQDKSTGVREEAQRIGLRRCKAPHSGRNEVTNRHKTLKLLPDSRPTLPVIKDNKVAQTVAAQEKHHGQAHRTYRLALFNHAHHDDPCRSVTSGVAL